MGDFAKYSTISSVLKGGFGQKLVRILGTLKKIETQNRLILIESEGSSIEVNVTEEQLLQLSVGMYLQIYGNVVPGPVNPKIAAKIVRNMDGINEESYNFAVKKFIEIMY